MQAEQELQRISRPILEGLAMGELPEAIRDRFRVEEELGRGSMGIVYRARDLRLDRLVALKVLFPVRGRPEERTLMEERLLREARMAARLQDPHIMTVYDILHAGNEWVLVLELVEGHTLRELLLREEDLPVGRVVYWLLQAARGLQAAHGAGVIHRDIKPENVMLQAGNRIKLMDFGVALANDTPRLTAVGQAMGTPAYIAPELLAGATPSSQTDLFALGVMAYELLRGENPFVGGDVMQVLGRIHHLTPPPLAEVCTDVPSALSRVVERLMAKDPEARYTSAMELVLDLEALQIPLTFGDPGDLSTLSHGVSGVPSAVQPTAEEPLPLLDPASPDMLALGRYALSGRNRLIVAGVAALVVMAGSALWALTGSPLGEAVTERAGPARTAARPLEVIAVPSRPQPSSQAVSSPGAAPPPASGALGPQEEGVGSTAAGRDPSLREGTGASPAAQGTADAQASARAAQAAAAALLQNCMHRRGRSEQLRCVEAPLKHWPRGKPVPEEVVRVVQLGLEQPETREQAARIAPDALPRPSLIQRMNRWLGSSDSDTRALAIQTLGRMGKPVSESEQNRYALHDEECPTRREAALYFVAHPSPKARPDLQAAYDLSYHFVEKPQTGLFGFARPPEKVKKVGCDHEALRSALDKVP